MLSENWIRLYFMWNGFYNDFSSSFLLCVFVLLLLMRAWETEAAFWGGSKRCWMRSLKWRNLIMQMYQTIPFNSVHVVFLFSCWRNARNSLSLFDDTRIALQTLSKHFHLSFIILYPILLYFSFFLYSVLYSI